jgi:multicomponent Na+:H+ antiporter subunit D
MSGLFRDMPLTAAALVVAMLAVVGVPPTGGFFTKWYLVLGALEAGRYDFAAALLVGSALAAFLAFRLFEIMRRDGSGIPGEVPMGMRVVTITAAAGTLATGLATGLIVDLIAPIAAMATR